VSQDKEPPKTTTGLGEAMGVIIILFLLLPFAAITLKTTTEIMFHPVCSGGK
jgi:hypothetical protein